MSTNTSTAAGPQNELEALEMIFAGKARLAKTDRQDQELSRLVDEIVEEADLRKHTNVFIEGTKARDLLAKLPKFALGKPQLLQTRGKLWRMLARGAVASSSYASRQECAEELLSIKSSSVFDATLEQVVREEFAREQNPSALIALLHHAKSTDNKSVIQKAWQTLGTLAPPKELTFAGSCLWALTSGHVGLSPDIWVGAFDLIHKGCIEFIETSMQTAFNAHWLRNELPPPFTEEGGTTIQFNPAKNVVKLNWKTGVRKQTLPAVREYVTKNVMPAGTKTILEWQARHWQQKRFGVELYVHIMPAEWTPGQLMTPLETISEVFEG